MSPPTLPSLLSFPTAGDDSPLNIPQAIGVQYRAFGILLLQDDRGNLVETIIHYDITTGAVDVNLSILSRWLNGRGKPPTWRSLLEVLRDIELCVLAHTIQQELLLRGWMDH